LAGQKTCKHVDEHAPSTSTGSFHDEHGNALKPAIMQNYNQHMGYVDKSDHMMNTYSISRQTRKWTKKLFFHLLDLTALYSYILLTSFGAKLTHREIRLSFIRYLIEEGGRVLGSQIMPQGMPILSTSWLEVRCSMHWRDRGSVQVLCRFCEQESK
jgi:hypothetical protein